MTQAAEAEKTYTEVPEQMRQALANHFRGIDFANLYVEQTQGDEAHPLGMIVKRVESKPTTSGPAMTPEQAWTHAAVCDIHWLAREDASVLGGSFMKDLFTPEQIAVHPNVTMVNDALSLDHLSHLRDEPNRHKELGKYRGHTDALNDMLINAAVADLPMYRSKVTNGLIQDMGAESYIAPKLAKNVIAIQILRAGQSMATSALKILPESALGSAGLYRDEEAQPHWYLWKMPKTDENTIILLLDPMLATAGSALEVRDRIEAEGIKYKEIRQVHQVGAPEGIVKILSRYPETKFYLAAQDSHLDGNSYIRPGLGDAGDNYFGTPHH